MPPSTIITNASPHPQLLYRSPLAGKRIYAVDDDLSCIHVLKLLLEGSGSKLTTFLSGENLLDALERKLPDLFIIDVVMSGIDGWELLVRIRENPKLKKTPVIVITSLFSKAEARGLNNGDDYCKILPKPTSRDQFNDIICRFFCQ